MPLYDVLSGFALVYPRERSPAGWGASELPAKRPTSGWAACSNPAGKRSVEEELGLSATEIARIRQALMALADKIRDEILPAHGGQVVAGLDGSGFGVDAHPGKGLGSVVVETTEEGAKAIEKLPGVTGVIQQPQFFLGALPSNQLKP